MADPERWVAKVRYVDSRGVVTDRVVSPLGYVNERTVRVFCLGREAIRAMRLSAILRVQLKLAMDVLVPEALQTIIEHRKIRQ